MKTWLFRFNIYFALAAVFLANGCSGVMHDVTHSKKEQTTIRLYLEGGRADTGTLGKVLVTRQKDPFVVEREPFLTEADVTKAVLVDDPQDGTYFIQVAFNTHGTLLLDMITTGDKGKHIIVFSQFPIPGQKQPKIKKKKHNEEDDDDTDQPPPAPPPETPGKPRQSAWLTAVLIRDRNFSGIFRFTPDASREEGERIVRGLKNVIAESKRAEKMQL